jgi:hypothetical protein
MTFLFFPEMFYLDDARAVDGRRSLRLLDCLSLRNSKPDQESAATAKFPIDSA